MIELLAIIGFISGTMFAAGTLVYLDDKFKWSSIFISSGLSGLGTLLLYCVVKFCK